MYSKFGEKLAVLFMLMAILYSLFSATDNWFEGQIDQKRAKDNDQRKEILQNFAVRAEKDIFLTRKILPLLRQITNDNSSIEQIHKHFYNKYNFELSLYQFSSTGKLANAAPNQPPNLWLMKNLYPAIAQTNSADMTRLAKKLDKKIQFAFGYGKDLVSIKKNPEKIIKTVFENQEGILAWTARKNGGVIIYAKRIPEQNQIFRSELNARTKKAGLQQIGLIHENGNENSLSKPELAYRYVLKKTLEYGYFAGKHWHFLKSSSGNIFFANFLPKACALTRILHLLRLAIAISGLIFVGIILLSNNVLSLKFLLISMFFATAMIPLTGIATTSFENLDVFQQIEAKKIRAVQEETLGNIAQNFSAYLASCSVSLLKLSNSPGSGQNDPQTLKMKDSILAIFPEAEITMRDSGGQKIFYHGTSFSQGRETVFKSLARKMIERYAPERLGEHKYHGNPFSDSLVNKDDMGFSTMLNHPNQLQVINTGNTELLLFYRILPASTGNCALIKIELSINETIKKYLQSLNQQRFNLENHTMQIAAFYPAGYRWSRRPIQAIEQHLLRLGEEVWLTGHSAFRNFSGHISGYSLASQFSALSKTCLIAFCEDKHITEALERKKLKLVLGSVTAVILLASIVLWLFRQLLSPLKHLGQGVEALSKRKFETRLPEMAGKDELASLFFAFNDMMAESYDMQIARNVQEGLVPQSFPDLKNFSVHGILREASELGGDCLDCFMIDEKKMLFMVGDITGHGVGSALIMAFAKAVTFHWSQSSDQLSPITLADQIDSMLRKNKTSRMFMGIICGILHVETGEIELVVKGHIYPLLVKSNGENRWVGIPAYPLGIGKPSPTKSVHLRLEPGDKILCITDGIIETRVADQPIGFEGIEKWARETIEPDAEAWVNALEEKHKIWSRGNQVDDISIFAISRNLGENP